MLAKYSSTCPLCGHKIKAGVDQIERKPSGVWAHKNCPLPSTAAPVGPLGQRVINITAEALAASLSHAAATAPEVEAAPAPAPVVAEKPFKPSKLQEEIFRAIASTFEHVVAEALAGSGKTTTLKHGARYIPANVALKHGLLTAEQAADIASYNPDDWAYLIDKYGIRVGMCAFNRHIAATLKNVMPEWMWTGTVHSMGFGICRKAFGGKIQVDENKVHKILDRYPETYVTRDMPTAAKLKRRTLRGAIVKLVSLAKAILVDYDDPAACVAMVEYYGLDLNGDEEIAIGLLPRVMEDCRKWVDVIDYDDMIWLPLVHNLLCAQFDYLFGDEVQDWNVSQQELIARSLRPGGRLIAVGDRFQSLYGFRGADVQAIPNLIERFNATVLPLSITYRCPVAVVREAQTIVPALQARENAPEGVVDYVEAKTLFGLLHTGDMVLCRTNAPLIPLAFRLIRANVKAVVRGRDIGKGLIELVDKFGTQDIKELDILLAEYWQRESERLTEREKWGQLQNLADKVETVEAMLGEVTSVQELVMRIGTLFSDENEGVVLSSVHRAKGLEAERVWILHPELMPHPLARNEWQQAQEANCRYVAITRALSELHWVKGEL